MKCKYLTYLLTSMLMLALHYNVYAQKDNIPPKVEMAGTQLLMFISATVGQEYQLYINLPG